MKRNNKKGFTLIELLAVIVILGIIALIATPIVINVIEKAKEESYKRSVEFAIDAAELYLVENGLSEIPEGGIDVKSLKLKNNNFESGKIVNKDGQVVAQNLSNGEYCASGEKGSIEVTKGSCGEIEEDTKPAEPVIKNGLVPVKIDNEGNVTKANTEEEWYNYDNQEWANAVLLTDSATESDYNNYTTPIPEEKIKAYFVWIPRYKYKIFNNELYSSRTNLEQREKEIEIKFQNINDKIYDGTENGQWLTHPAFTTLGVSGIWVGKFELTGDINNITVKPNLNSMIGQKVQKFFDLLYKFDRNLDSHMMKNTEWGAVAYLYHSKYGKYGNELYKEAAEKEVYINNCENMITGIAGDSASASSTNTCTNTYETEKGKKASTTGNITGIYDMSGGIYEFVAGYRKNGSMSSSGFTSEPIEQYPELKKYFDVYDDSSVDSNSNYTTRKLGDATGEMGPFGTINGGGISSWYGDNAGFVMANIPWFGRGGIYGDTTRAGVFYFIYSSGASSTNFTSRLVLSPSK